MTPEAFALMTYGYRHSWHCRLDASHACTCGLDAALGVVTFIEPHPASPHFTHVIEDLGEGRWHCIQCAGGTFKEINPDA